MSTQVNGNPHEPRRVCFAQSVTNDAPQISVPREILAAHPNGFFLMVEGESMNQVVPNGWFVFVDPSAPVEDGDIVAAHIAGQGQTLKRYHRSDRDVILRPDSSDPAWADDMRFDAGLVSFLGKAVYWRAPHQGETARSRKAAREERRSNHAHT